MLVQTYTRRSLLWMVGAACLRLIGVYPAKEKITFLPDGKGLAILPLIGVS